MRKVIVGLVGVCGVLASFSVLAHEDFDDHDFVQEGADVQSVIVPGAEPVSGSVTEQYQEALEEAMRKGDLNLVGQLRTGDDELSKPPTPEATVVVGIEQFPFTLLDFSLDRDQDGLSDSDEIRLLTNPSNPDTDGDGYIDSLEVIRGYNPLVAGPGDKIEYTEPAGLPDELYRITGIRLTEDKGEQKLTITGTGPVNSMVAILIYATENKAWFARTDMTGRFLLVSADALDPGEYRVYASSVSVDGLSLMYSKPLEFERTLSSLIKKVKPSPEVVAPTNEGGENKLNNIVFIVGAAVLIISLGALTFIWKRRKKGKIQEVHL